MRLFLKVVSEGHFIIGINSNDRYIHHFGQRATFVNHHLLVALGMMILLCTRVLKSKHEL